MLIELGNAYAKVSEASEEELNWLYAYLSFENHKVRFIPGYQWDRKVHLFNTSSSSFPTGFVKMVTDSSVKVNFTVSVKDSRNSPCSLNALANLDWLRHYQKDAVNTAIKRTRGILSLSTGAGKTECAVGIVKSLPCRWMFITHRASLVEQTIDRFNKRTDYKVGKIADGVVDLQEPVTIVTFQSLNTLLRKKDIETFLWPQGIIVDECHCLGARSYYKIVMKMTNAYYRFGLSATPLARSDKFYVVGSLGSVICKVTSSTLIEENVLAKPIIKMLRIEQESSKPTWQGVYEECIVKSSKRNDILANAIANTEKPCLVFVKDVAHGKLLEKYLTRLGSRCAFVWGTHSMEWRRSLCKRLTTGDLDTIICSVIFQEGVDIPELRSVVIGSGGKSNVATIQRIGRGMRMSKGKAAFLVIDVFDEGNKWLEAHSTKRKKSYENDGFEVEVL